ncbi:MAG: hypothetical protein IH605_00645 [Burkholderiales bacterium]|nr:hypothetical protein [Burkholderiales bacterium]
MACSIATRAVAAGGTAAAGLRLAAGNGWLEPELRVEVECSGVQAIGKAMTCQFMVIESGIARIVPARSATKHGSELAHSVGEFGNQDARAQKEYR